MSELLIYTIHAHTSRWLVDYSTHLEQATHNTSMDLQMIRQQSSIWMHLHGEEEKLREKEEADDGQCQDNVYTLISNRREYFSKLVCI